MKIVHLNKFDSGGAAYAAIRLHEGLINAGIDSYFLTLGDKNKNITNKHVITRQKPTRLVYWLARIGIYLKKSLKNKYTIKRLSGKYEIFSFPESDYNLHEHSLIKEADIIHFHWISDFVDLSTFFKQVNKKPVIWTLHDMNPFQGGFHYLGDVLSNPKFNNIEKKLRLQKLEYYKEAQNLHLITLCNWMKTEVEKSDLLKKFSSTIIPNSVSPDFFKLRNKNECRAEFGYPIDKKMLIFVSESLDNRRKGGKVLYDALTELDSSDVELICVGINNGKSIFNKLNCHFTGKISDQETMAKLYSCADYFVLPSSEDNLPNVMLESLCSGVPVIAFNVGGMKDHIKNDENGFLVNEISAHALSQTIDKAIKHEHFWDNTQISLSAQEKFSPESQVKKVLRLYQKALQTQ